MNNQATQVVTKSHICYGNTKIPFVLYQNERKTFRIDVSPDMSVVVKAPHHISKEQIFLKIQKKAPRVSKQIRYFKDFYPKISPRKYVSGETFLYLGRQYILKVEHTVEKEYIKLLGKFMIVYVFENNNVEKMVDTRYQINAKKKFEQYFYPILDIFKKYNIFPKDLKVRKMKKRWGSCTKTGIIILNSELLQAPRGCIEYVIIHECCHLVEFGHTKSFYNLQSSVMPDWGKWKVKLEKLLA